MSHLMMSVLGKPGRGDSRPARGFWGRGPARDGPPEAGWPHPLRDGALPGAALTILIAWLAGPAGTVLGAVGVAAAAGLVYGRRAWPAALGLLAPAANVLIRTGHLPAGVPAGPARLVLSVLEGLLIGALLLRLGAAARGAADARAAGRASRDPAPPDGGARARLLQESSHRSRERFRLLVDGVQDHGIFMLDPDGRVASWGAGAERLTGYPDVEALGLPFAVLCPAAGGPRGAAPREWIEAGADGRDGEGPLHRRDGTPLWVHYGVSALRDEPGSLRGYAVVVRDITERRRAEEALRRAHDEMEARVRDRTAALARANEDLRAEMAERRRAEDELRGAKELAEAACRAKDQFLAALSHELRTPLTPALLTVAALLEEPEAAGELRPALEMVRRNIESEARLIDDLLDVVRATRGRLSLELRRVDVHAVLRQALATCRPEIEAAGLALGLELSAPEHHATADPDRLQQVFWNLIKNAAKFTPRGGSLVIRSHNEDASSPGPDTAPGAGRLVIEVADDGIGIEPDVLPRIFDPFEQGTPALRRRSGGLGLGLAISRTVAEAHGGRLTAASAGTGRGTTFTLELAVEPAEAPASTPAPAPAPAPAAGPGPLQILLVEDNRDTLRALARLLERHGHRVRAAADLATARRLAAAGPFDLLLSDIDLPDGDGRDLMRELRQRGAVPGIAMSGFGSEADIRASREAGFAAHLIKPITPREVDDAIRRVLLDAGGEPAGREARPA
jgi:PAS domain S-box-containing protein